MKKTAFTSHSLLSKTEWGTNYGKYKLHFRSALYFVLADDSEFEDLNSDYEYDILKKYEIKNNGDQSDPH